MADPYAEFQVDPYAEFQQDSGAPDLRQQLATAATNFKAKDKLAGTASAVNEAWQGLHDIWSGQGVDAKATGLHRVMGAVGQATLPIGVLAALANPVTAVGVAGGGLLGNKAATMGADALHASPGVRSVAGDIGGLLGGVGGGKLAPMAVEATRTAIPSTDRASQNFSQVMGAAADVPIDVSAPGNIALETKDLAARGGSMPKVIRDFISRTTEPNSKPLTYQEARDFYSNATRLSADENMRLTPVMRRQVGMFTDALNSSLEGAASQAGKLAEYQSAMAEYRNAMRVKGLLEGAKEIGVKGLAKGIAGAGLGAGGYYAVKGLLGQ